MAVTYEPIATTTTANNTTKTITFSSISGSYTDLVLVMGFALVANDEVRIRFNSDTGSNYSRTYFEGNGTTASSARQSSVNDIQILGRNARMTNIVNIQNYSNSTTYKTFVGRFASSTINGGIVALWRSTSAITSIEIRTDTNAFDTSSTFTLYGIKAA